MSKNPWNPAEQFKGDIIDLSVSIKGPPCSTCEFWNPYKQLQRLISTSRVANIICCHATSMYSDFSCYKEDENA